MRKLLTLIAVMLLGFLIVACEPGGDSQVFQYEVVYGLDKLVYSNTKELNVDNQVEPKLPTEQGQYKIKIYISDEFYLGSVFITITE